VTAFIDSDEKGNSFMIERGCDDSSTFATWSESVRDDWASIPARALLNPLSSEFIELGLRAITVTESIAFAAVSRLVKYGESITIALPLANGETLLHLSYYLHRLRLDAFDDLIRTPWLNHQAMSKRPHLVVLTRPLARHRLFARVASLHPSILRPSKESGQSQSDRLATFLIACDQDPVEALDVIEKKTRPFAFIVDATPSGCGDGFDQFINSLQKYFPDVPRIVVAALGDVGTMESLKNCVGAGHIWQMRLPDIAFDQNGAKHIQPSFPKRASSVTIDVGVVNDTTTNALLVDAFDKCWKLKCLCEQEGNVTRAKIMSPLNKVMTGLRNLHYPLSLLEDQLTRDTKPGRFPIRALSRWLQLSNDASFRHGLAQAAHSAARSALLAAHAHLMVATTGKEQAMLALIAASAKNRKNVCILIGSVSEAKLLFTWLDQKLDGNVLDRVTIEAMDDKRAPSFGINPQEHVIIAGMLWPSRMRWLALECQHLTVLCYPFEASMIEKQMRAWVRIYRAESAPHGDKFDIWAMNWKTHRRLDVDVVDGSAPLINALEWQYSGVHPKVPSISIFNMNDRHVDWMNSLLAEPEHDVENRVQVPSDIDVEIVWINVSEHEASLPWNRHHPVLVLHGDELVSKMPSDLIANDAIVLMINNDERIATQASLFELFVNESSGLEQFTMIAEVWQSMVTAAHIKLKTVKALREVLKAGGVNVIDQTVKNWIGHHVIGPEDALAIQIIAEFLGKRNPEKMAKRINAAIVKIRTERRTIGRDLQAAILARVKGADQVRIGKLTLDVNTLDSMVEICHVDEVNVPPLDAKLVNIDLCSVASEVMTMYPNKLVFTPAGQRSMRDSQFRDNDRFRHCLSLMAVRLHSMYCEKQERMNDVLPVFKDHQITFAAGMSETTQGRFDIYRREYAGVKVDIGRHFRIGTSFDPTRTIRVHFHWDEAEQTIVIHHAGEHLPTRAS
jgi:hypothetical protein